MYLKELRTFYTTLALDAEVYEGSEPPASNRLLMRVGGLSLPKDPVYSHFIYVFPHKPILVR